MLIYFLSDIYIQVCVTQQMEANNFFRQIYLTLILNLWR